MTIRPSLVRLFAFACVASLALLSLNAQDSSEQNQAQPQKQIFRSTTRLVVVDIVATDDKGQPVKDLKSEDFVVTENNDAQKVIDFSFHQPGSVQTLSYQLPGNVFTNSPQYTGNSSLNVILLDAINTDFSNHAYAQDIVGEVSGHQSQASANRGART